MKSTDMNTKVTAAALNESLYEKFNVKINFDKYTREQLEDSRNKLRTKIAQAERTSKYNDLLTNETYQKDKFILGVLNTKIREMLGEAKVAEKAVSKAQQQAAAIALAGKKSGKEPSGKASKSMSKMSTKELEKYARTETGDLPAHKTKKKVKESRDVIVESIAFYLAEDEEGKAKSITAAADIVNNFTTWMQKVANYQTKSLSELTDNIRSNFGPQEAEAFRQTVGLALQNASEVLSATREGINNAVAVLAGESSGEAPMGVEPIETPMEPADGEAELPPADVPAAEPADIDALNAGNDEFSASDAAAGGSETAGRMKRESIERSNRLMRVLSS